VEPIERVEAALGAVESDPAALEAVQAVVELYGEGLRRMVAGAGVEDELVAHLLVLHDLHPVPVEERVRDALGKGVELVSIDGGVVQLRMNGGCTSPADEVKAAVAAAAPDVDEIVVAEMAGPEVIRLPQAAPA
jgi:hypothetical protein